MRAVMPATGAKVTDALPIHECHSSNTTSHHTPGQELLHGPPTSLVGGQPSFKRFGRCGYLLERKLKRPARTVRLSRFLPKVCLGQARITQSTPLRARPTLLSSAEQPLLLPGPSTWSDWPGPLKPPEATGPSLGVLCDVFKPEGVAMLSQGLLVRSGNFHYLAGRPMIGFPPLGLGRKMEDGAS